MLAHSLQVWLQQQRSHVKLTIRRPGGSEIEIDASNVRDVQALVESASRDGFHGWPMRLPDPGTSRALILGTSRFRHPDLPELPTVVEGVAAMARVMRTSRHEPAA